MTEPYQTLPSLSTLEYLLRIHWSPLAHPDASAPDDQPLSWRRAVRWLQEEGLIEPHPPRDDCENASCYRTTDRARVFIEHLRGLPLPITERRWVIPPLQQGGGRETPPPTNSSRENER